MFFLHNPNFLRLIKLGLLISKFFYRNRGAFIQPRPEKQIISNHRSLKINIAKILVLPILTPDWKPEILLEKMKIDYSKILDKAY